MNQLQEVTAEMLRIERINMAYNQETNFGMIPNGQEDEIAALLERWDDLKALRTKLKGEAFMDSLQSSLQKVIDTPISQLKKEARAKKQTQRLLNNLS